VTRDERAAMLEEARDRARDRAAHTRFVPLPADRVATVWGPACGALMLALVAVLVLVAVL
jgi:hypothetical protein